MTFNPHRKAAKYNASHVMTEAGSFDSILEKDVYDMLVMKFGVDNVDLKPTVSLVPGITWRVDFGIRHDGLPGWVEAKGVSTADYKLKLRLWRLLGPGTLKIYRRDPHTGMIFCEETVQPQGYRLLPPA